MQFILKKLISIVIVAIILFNTLGNLIVFEGMYYTIHKNVRTTFFNTIPDKQLILIAINNKTKLNLRFFDKKEFIYNGKLYDIVRQKSEGNTTIYYCLNDTKEENLFSNLNKDIKKNMDSIPVKNKAQQILKKITTPLFYENNKEFTILNLSCFFHPSKIINIYNTYIDVLTPPPLFV